MTEKRIRNNRLNVEWSYAGECWSALNRGEDIPPVPFFTIWENDGDGERIVDHRPIKPKAIHHPRGSFFCGSAA